jgi:DNA primase
VIAMHSAGFSNTVASCGTAVTENQLRLILRETNKLTLMSDGDAAGMASAASTGAMAIKLGFYVRQVRLPDKSDPYDLIQKYDRQSS